MLVRCDAILRLTYNLGKNALFGDTVEALRSTVSKNKFLIFRMMSRRRMILQKALEQTNNVSPGIYSVNEDRTLSPVTSEHPPESAGKDDAYFSTVELEISDLNGVDLLNVNQGKSISDENDLNDGENEPVGKASVVMENRQTYDNENSLTDVDSKTVLTNDAHGATDEQATPYSENDQTN